MIINVMIEYFLHFINDVSSHIAAALLLAHLIK